MADHSSPPSSPVAGTEAAEQEHESLIWIDRPKYICASCGCDLALQDELVSRAFSGRAGPAFLMRSAFNVRLAKSEQKMLLTGMHTISNLSCRGCDAPLGWVYLKANDAAQKYKEGKYIIEKDKVMKDNCWSPGELCKSPE